MNIWKWLWNTETKYYDEEITRDTDWGGDESTGGVAVSGGRIQEWLKNEINGKFGVIRISSAVNERNFYSLEMFSTKEDEQLYGSDPETYKDRITIVPIPISTVQGDTFSSLLRSSIPSSDIVITGNELLVPLNFRAVRVTPLENINMNSRGTLVVQRSTDNGATFNDVGSLPNAILSVDYDLEEYTDIDLGKFVNNGKQMLRVRALFDYEDEATGTTKTAVSAWVNVGNTVTKTELKLNLETNYFTPMLAKNEETGEYNRFVVNYRVLGATKKKLYVTVNGSIAPTTVVKELTTEVDGTTEGISLGYDANFGFHTHGVHEVVAYLEAEDGLGNTIKSEELRNQFMMVNPESEGYDATQKFLLLQNVKQEATNYIQTEVAQYAVYSPDKSDTELTFKITNAKDVPYTEVTKTAVANTANAIEMTVEIEPEDEGNIPEGYRTRFYVFKDNENFIASSGLNEFGYYDLYVDNSEAVVPVLGSTFLMNPKNRDNSEANPKRILNERANNIEVDSTWENFGFINDGWMLDEDGNKVLRVMAGSKLTIKRNIFKQFLSAPDSAMTIDIDYKVSNVTDVDNPVIAIDGGGGKGLFLNALKGWVRTASYNDNDNCMFAWRETKRQFVSLNIHNNVRPLGKECVYPNDKASQAQGSMALARVLLNGDPIREIPFDKTSTTEWCTDENAAIVIGNEGADIDIYSIRVYENTQVDIKDLLNRNWISSLPTTAEKKKEKDYNNLLEGGRITLEKAQARGLNCIVYHGDRPYAFNTAEPYGWIEYFRYNQNGEYMPEYSGKNCESSKGLQWKAQGSTAKTYYEHNVQDDNSKVKATIEVPVTKFHESIKVRIDGDKAYITGGNLGKNFPLEAEEAEYPYANGYVTVPDGWFDGNGMYRGMGYCVAPNTSLAQKKVAKINYASAMQSHLIGACKSYDELHYLVCGASPLQQQYLDKGLTRPVSAKHTEPFLMFWEMDGVVYYTGLCVYGAGKMDKVSWGYVKKKHPMFAMFEGADNNLPLTDFRVSFDDAVTYDVDEEGYVYNGSQSFDFDAGATDDNDVPKAEIVNQWKAYHNFIYLNSPNIEFYDGTIDQFRLSEQATKNLSTKYWCTEGSKAYQLIRYDYVNEKWVDAGLKGADGEYAVVDLRTDIRTKATYEKYKTSTAYATINEAFKGDFGKFFKANAKFLMSLDSLLFCYSYVLSFLAGTDNSSKNTYFKIDPIKQDMSAQANDEFSAWWMANFGVDFNYAECYLMFMDGDDMDSILPVNNKGNLTKPYYIERLYPYSDDAPSVCLYEGMENQLFNLVELIYSDEERSAFMNRILTAAQSLVTTDDKLLGLQDNKVSVWGFLHKYFFNIQYYFPKIAYLEQARIRYEFAELMGHTGARSVRPISQSIGSQVENEQQFMEQRVVYMASFAVFGALGNKSGAIGLADTVDELAFQGSQMPDGSPSDFVFDVTPHQYIYPCGFDGQTTRPTYQRTSPKQTCKVTVAKGVVGTSDTSMGIRGVNYYSDLGNFKDKSITTDLTIIGKRLLKFECGAFTGYPFKPSSLKINAFYIESIRLTNTKRYTLLDFSKLSRLSTITRGGTFDEEVLLPEGAKLKNVLLSVRKISINNAPNITSIYLASQENIDKLFVGKNVGTNVEGFTIQSLVESIYNAQKTNKKLTSIHVEDIKWSNFDVNALDWLSDIETCELKGTIGIREANVNIPAVTWNIKNKFLSKFGNVDDAKSKDHRGLLLDYAKKPFDASMATIRGNFFVDDLKVMNNEYNEVEDFLFEVKPYSQYENTQTKVAFSVQGSGNYTMNEDGTFKVRMYELSKVEQTAIVKANVTQYENGTSVTESLTKEIDVWIRPAQVGDLVYYDGTYGDAAKDNDEKTVVGLCCYVAPRKTDGSINERFHNPLDKHTRLMVGMKNVEVSSNTVNYIQVEWGATGGQGTNSLFTTNADGTKKDLSIDGGLSTIYSVPNIPSNSTIGLYLVNNNATGAELTDESIVDFSDEGIENGGFRPIDAIRAAGDGFAYNESAVYIANRTLKGIILKLAGDGYAEDDIVNSGYAKTLHVIAHRNNIINYNTENGINGVYFPLSPVAESAGKSELNVLASLISEIRAWAKGTGEGQFGDTQYGDKWSQLYYPLASACYAYEPTNLKTGELLHASFKKRNWFLPTAGLLIRLLCYTYILENGSVKDRENSPFKDVMNYGGFQKITGGSFGTITQRTADTYWSVSTQTMRIGSSTKGVSSLIRPVCAF